MLAKKKQTTWKLARKWREAGRVDGDKAAEGRRKTGGWLPEGGKGDLS